MVKSLKSSVDQECNIIRALFLNKDKHIERFSSLLWITLGKEENHKSLTLFCEEFSET